MNATELDGLMRRWSAELGMDCRGCHTEDGERNGPDGRPIVHFTDDSRPLKRVARRMYTMTAEMKRKYIGVIEGSGMPITCGTCHRGTIGRHPPAEDSAH